MSTLSEYITQMRQRHARLTVRQMAREAGISDSVLYGILNQGRGARPETLKALADKWGTPEDYRELMQRAGHPLPEPATFDAALLEQMILTGADPITPEDREHIIAALMQDAPTVEIIERLMQQRFDEADLDPQNFNVDLIKQLTFPELVELVSQLTPEQRQLWLAQSIRWLYRATGRQSDSENKTENQ